MRSKISTTDASHLAVILATRNRPVLAQRAAKSILACSYSDFHLIIVDQSDDRETEAQIGSLDYDPRVIYAAHHAMGLSAGRNFGARIAQQLGADWLVFTDDDCEAQQDWLTSIRHAIAFDPRIALLYGAAVASDYNRAEGMIPSYQPERFLVVEGIASKYQIDGIGASMALRMDAWSRLGGFDELLGAGGTFRSGEDTDMTIRVLLAGYKVCETPDAVVVHHGFRSWQECPELIAGYMYGLGATMMKMIRLGGVKAMLPLSQLGWRWVAGAPKVDLNHQPPRLDRLAAFLQGAKAAAQMELTSHGIFRAPDSIGTAATRKGPAQERKADQPQQLRVNS